jgi:hypothetical protein
MKFDIKRHLQTGNGETLTTFAWSHGRGIGFCPRVFEWPREIERQGSGASSGINKATTTFCKGGVHVILVQGDRRLTAMMRPRQYFQELQVWNGI